MTSAKNIIVIYTGGTFGMMETPEGLTPLPLDVFEPMLQYEVADIPNINLRLLQTPRIFDSSQATIEDWNMVGQIIAKQYNNADAFIVIHGTDTMDFGCAALHNMLESPKPIVVTGSMLPLLNKDGDALENFRTAVKTIQDYKARGVLFAFRGEVFHPERFFKYATENPQIRGQNEAFQRIGQPLNSYFTNTAAQGGFSFTQLTEHYIPLISFTPGNSDPFKQCRLDEKPDAILLEGLGNGNIPFTAEAFLAEAKQRNIPVFCISAAPMGKADHTYAAGSWAARHDVTNLEYMTRAASIMKLQRVLTDKASQNPNLDLKQAMIAQAQLFAANPAP